MPISREWRSRSSRSAPLTAPLGGCSGLLAGVVTLYGPQRDGQRSSELKSLCFREHYGRVGALALGRHDFDFPI